MLPNLFVIGAAKSGTTSLHHYLGQHPDIFMSPVKEPNYFAFEEEVPVFSGPDESGRSSFERDRLQREKYEFSVVDRPNYEVLFAKGANRRFRGESSASYLYFPGTAARLQKQVPDARIIAVLRHPVERAVSKFQQMRRDHAEPLPTFAEAVEAEPRRLREGWAPTWLYMDRGYYARQLKPYFDIFRPEQIHVLLYEDLRRDPKQCLRDIFGFLQVDPDIAIDTDRLHNVSAVPEVPRFALLYRAIVRPFLHSARLQGLLPTKLADIVRPLARRFLLKRTDPVDKARVTPELHDQLLEEFRADIVELQEIIGRDLSHWLQSTASGQISSNNTNRPTRQLADSSA